MKPCLCVVDMQNYYFNKHSDFAKLSDYYCGNDSLKYICDRCKEKLIPNIKKLQKFFRKNGYPVIFLRLCGEKEDRSDLHRFFRKNNILGERIGFKNVYPLVNDPMSFILEEIKPLENESVFCKTTFSAFNSTNIKEYLEKEKITHIFFTGIATSQCVETTARDASEYGYSVIHVEDAEGDYTEKTHLISLSSSKAVCGGWVNKTDYIINNFDFLIEDINNIERNFFKL